MKSAPLLLSLACVTALSGACNNNSMKVQHEVTELRVLGIRAEPPELHVEAIEDWDATHVTFDALVVNPKKSPVTYTWSFCPIESDRACVDFEEQRVPWSDIPPYLALVCGGLLSNPEAFELPEELDEAAWDQILADLDALYALKLTGTATVIESEPATLRYDLPPFPVSLFKSLAMYHCMTDLISAPAGWWPAVQLEVSDGDTTVTAFKRVVLSIGDLAGEKKSSFFEDGLGLPLCAYTTDTECLDLFPPEDERNSLNINPVIETIQMSDGDSSTGPFCDLTGEAPSTPCELSLPLKVLPETPFRLRLTFPPESEQNYQVFQTDLAARRLRVQDRVEEYSVNWFITEGSVQETITWRLFTKTLDTAYTPPQTLKKDSDGLLWVWMILRDQRGGVNWAEVPLLLNP